MSKIAFIGYGGHAFVVAEIALMNGYELTGYFDKEEKKHNPFNLSFLGEEKQFVDKINIGIDFFLCIGNNEVRKKVHESLMGKNIQYAVLKHPSAIISKFSTIGKGTVITASCTINPFVTIGEHVICNTGCIIDHECNVEDFVHIAPGAVLAGNVHVGEGTLIGANSVIKQGVKIGKNVIVGAGSVILNDVANGETVYGNPGRNKFV
jgi:sugar O-acyltransferase (sialic acid O-acetyltransferase NeuD family)